MSQLPIDTADWSNASQLGSGLLLNNQALTVPTVGSQATLGPYYVATAEQLMVQTTLSAPLVSGQQVAWSLLWADGTATADGIGFVTNWYQSTDLGSAFIVSSVIAPYVFIVADNNTGSNVSAGVSLWRIGAGATPATCFGPQVLATWDQSVALDTTVAVHLNNMVPGKATLVSLVQTTAGTIRLQDTTAQGLGTWFQHTAQAANELKVQEIVLPASDFQVTLGGGTTPAAVYAGSLIAGG